MNYNGIYRGIVIQNNDPLGVGRVKVYVPEVNAVIIKNWNEKKTDDKMFKVMGGNSFSSLSPELQRYLKAVLPWAEVSLPVFGMSTPSTFEAASNTSVLGNSGHLESQRSKRSPEAIQKDLRESEQNRQQSTTYAKEPRTAIQERFPSTINYCIPRQCSNQNNFPSIWLGYNKNDCLTEKIRQLPRNYTLCDSVSSIDEIPTTTLPTPNTSVVQVEIDLQNPRVFVQGNEINLEQSRFKTQNCFDVEPTFEVNYDVPVVFEESIGSVSDTVPLQLNVNGKPLGNFTTTTENNDLVFTNNDTRVVANRNNINQIRIKYNNSSPLDLSFIQNILNYLNRGFSMFESIRMPRGASNGKPIVSRQGSGADLYNRVNTKLLDRYRRTNSLIGGHNLISKGTINYGRKSKLDENYRGNNMQSAVDASGPVRPPNQGNNFKGMISIPAPDSHVYVRFENGDTNYPIIMGTYANQNEYTGVFGGRK